MNHNQKSNCPFLANYGPESLPKNNHSCPAVNSSSNSQRKLELELLAMLDVFEDLLKLFFKQQTSCKMQNCSTLSCGCLASEPSSAEFECPHLEEVHNKADMNKACPFLAAHTKTFECPHLEELHNGLDMTESCPFLEALHEGTNTNCSAECNCSPSRCDTKAIKESSSQNDTVSRCGSGKCSI